MEMPRVVLFFVSDFCRVVSPVKGVSDIVLRETIIILGFARLAQCLRVHLVKELVALVDRQKDLSLIPLLGTNVDHVLLLLVIVGVELEEAEQDVGWGPL